jgi:hypothetical protein
LFNYGIKIQAKKFTALFELGEIFIKSFPQYITQFLMVSAKGSPEGFKEFSDAEQLSVITSGISISLGIASFMINQKNTNNFISNRYHSFASFVSITIFIISEIAFVAGIGRFAFASDLTFDFPESTGKGQPGLLFPKFHLLYFFPLLYLSTFFMCCLMLFPGRCCNKCGRLATFLLLKLFLVTSFITFHCLDSFDVTSKYLAPHEGFSKPWPDGKGYNSRSGSM